MTVPDDQIWMVVVGFLIAFLLALGIGANDVANTFGTSVGAKVLTLRQACILASVFETLGAVLIGAKVSDTVRKGIIDPSLYDNQTELFMVGNVAALSGSCVWLGLATFFKMPVSGTHSIIGAIVGFTLVAKGVNGISWDKLGLIVASWFISPVLSGIVSLGLFFIVKLLIISNPMPLEAGLKLLPVFYGCTLVINAFSIFYDGPEILGFDKIPLWGTFILSFGIGAIVGILVKCLLVPMQRRKILDDLSKFPPGETANGEVRVMPGSEPVPAAMMDNYIWEERDIDISRTEKAVQTDVAISANGLTSGEGFTTDPPPSYENYAADLGEADQGIAVISQGISSGAYAGDILRAERPNRLPTLERGQSEEKKKRSRTLSLRAPREDALVLPDNEEENANDNNNTTIAEADENSTEIETNVEIDKEKDAQVKDRPETARLFSFLQILTAVFGAFAHGGNDVSNAIGPVVSIWIVASTQELSSSVETPIWILLIGGLGISVGLWIWGRRVIETMGEDLTAITPSSGFCIEIGAAFSVLVASNIGIPVSSTHCKVGSIVFVGRYRSKENVDWKIFRNIVMAWLLTLPACVGLSALFMLAFQEAV